MSNRSAGMIRLFCIFLLLCFSVSLSCYANLASDVMRDVQNDLKKIDGPKPPGKILLSDDFTSGNLDKWTINSGWSLEPATPGSIPYVKAVSNTGYINLITKDRIEINPRHAIAVTFKTRRLSGTSSMFLRIDAFDEQGKFLCANQDIFGDGGEWTPHNVLINNWIPAEASTITVQFFLDVNAETTTALTAVKVIDLTPRMEYQTVIRLDSYAKKLAAAKTQLDTLPVTNRTSEWKKDLTAVIGRGLAAVNTARKANPLGAEYPKAVENAGMWANRVTDILAGIKDGRVTTNKFVVYSTDPISRKMVLPEAGELAGIVMGKASITTCAGEYESASLVLWSPAGVKDVLPKALDFKGPSGIIPGSSVDIKWVKAWFQAGGAPYSVAVSPGKSLVTELLLNDDSMVKVDLQAKNQWIKLHFPEGDKYVAIDSPEKPNPEWGIETPEKEFPARDSDVLLASDIPSCQNKQVWLTVHVPDNAKPGKYIGKIEFISGNKSLGSVNVTLQVLPFALPAPKTRYDLTKDYTGSLYYWGILSKSPDALISYKTKNETQFRAELKSMYTHNIVAPGMVWGPDLIYKDESQFRKSLSIMKEIGMSGRPLYLTDSGLIGNATDPASLAALKINIAKSISIAKEYGFPEIYFYGIDEAVGEVLKSERIAWVSAHEAGAQIMVSGWGNIFDLVGDMLDLLNWTGDAMQARVPEWHKNGHKVWNYANPQTPVEDAEVYRRNYGLYNWKLNLDGTCTYCYMDSSGKQWNDWDGATYRDHCVAYPTTNGVVTTLALEGLREALEDVKYATKLMMCIDENQNGRKSKKAADAKKWLDNLDTTGSDLHAVRREMVKRIIELNK